jgi:hypothetical protein
MKLSKIVVFCFLAMFAFKGFAEDDDFGGEPVTEAPTAPPPQDITAPPSESGDYNQELSDVVGEDEPKVPEPESPAPVAPVKHKKANKAEKHAKKKGKKEKKSAKGKKDKKGAKGKKGHKDGKSGKKDKNKKKKKHKPSAE